MGTSRSVGEFSRKITNLGTVTQSHSRMVVEQGALTAKEIILAEAASKGITPAQKIARGRWGVRYDILGTWNPTALVRVWGPFHLVDNPTKPHDIRPRTKGRRRSGKQAIAFDGIARASAHHPGTHGNGIFPAAKAKARVAVPIVMSQRIVGGWRQALK